MALKAICDKHGEKCPKGAVETRSIFDRFTGERMLKDLCSSGWGELEGENAGTMEGTRPDPSVIQEPARTTVPVSKPKSKGKSSSNGEVVPYPEWEPFKAALTAWHTVKHGGAPRGRWTPDGKAAKEFREAPEGAPWKEWEPGKPLPSGV